MFEQREIIIQNYIAGYNELNIDKMIIDFDNEIVFQNVQNDIVTMTIIGVEDFRRQAEQVKSYFVTREQRITAIHHYHDNTTINIDYSAVLAIDFPNGLRKGQKLKLKGTSIFRFKNNQIIELIDKS